MLFIYSQTKQLTRHNNDSLFGSHILSIILFTTCSDNWKEVNVIITKIDISQSLIQRSNKQIDHIIRNNNINKLTKK